MLKKPSFFITIALLFVVAATSRGAEVELKGEDLVKATLIADVDAIGGDSFTLGIHLKMKPHWHTYWVNPGESGEATTVKITGPAGFEFGPVQWPLPKAMESFGAITYGYEDEVLLLVPVKVTKPLGADASPVFDADVKWLACHDTCIEGSAKLSLKVPVGKPFAPGRHLKMFDDWRKRLPTAMSTESPALAKANQSKTQPVLALEWKDEVKKVEWFPIATQAVAIENIVVKHEGKATRITFKPSVYKPDMVPGGKMESVVVFEDGKGNRQGIVVPFMVDVGD